MECCNCNNELVPGSKFCSNCGAKTQPALKNCPNPNCGREGLPLAASYCPDCGTKLAAMHETVTKEPLSPKAPYLQKPIENSLTQNGINWENQKFGHFTDSRDNQSYKVVKIGNQIWMAENLRFRAANGCWVYDNNLSNVHSYGYLYNWETAIKVPPKGWHLPSDNEWDGLTMSLNNNQSSKNNYRDLGISAKLKSTTGWCKTWFFVDHNGNNQSGFNAYPTGIYRLNSFCLLGISANFWTSSQKGLEKAFVRWIERDIDAFFKSCHDFDDGLSVRCLKD